MSTSHAYLRLAVAALIGLLAGCSSGSQLGPAGNLAGQPAAQGEFSNATAQQPESLARDDANVSGKWVVFGRATGDKKIPPPSQHYNYIFTNDALLADVDVYQAGGGVFQPTAQCVGCGGWGLASHQKGEVAYGVNGGHIQVIKVAKAGGVPVISAVSTLTLTSGNALGMAFDNSGNLYASTFPSNCWDKFSASAVGSGGAPTGPFCNSAFSLVAYLATSGNTLYVDGIDSSSGNFATGTATTLIQDVPNLCGTGFTTAFGGLDIQPTSPKTMAVSNGAGCMTEWNPPSYTAQSTNVPTHYGWPATEVYTDVVFGHNTNNLWASGYAPGGSCGAGSPPCGFLSAWTISPTLTYLGTTIARPGEAPISIAQMNN